MTLSITCYNENTDLVEKVMADALLQDFVPFEEYLAGERDVDVRSEYVEGQVYAMAGASETHNTIASELHTLINSHLSDECRAWQSDMKVVGDHQDKFFAYYPDIMASCEENTGDLYYRTNPSLIIEVLSPSTQRADLKEKFDNYISISTLIEYVVVSSDTPHVRVFRRGNAWQLESYYANDTFILESVNLEVLVKQIYRRVKREVGLEVRGPRS